MQKDFINRLSFAAFYTQPGGPKTTTINNAFSDLYNMTVGGNNLVTSKRL